MTMKEKECPVCNKCHTKRGKTCGKEECIRVSISNTLSNGFEKLTQNLHCSYCGVVYDVKVVNKKNFGIEALVDKVMGYCSDECREKKRKEGYENMGKSVSKRMTENNPMKRKDVAARVSATIKKRFLNGEIEYKSGIEHHLYTGNRALSKGIRDILYKRWSYWIMYRFGFSCSKCGSTGELHIHHRYPLRYIVAYLMQKYDITKEQEKTLKKDYILFSFLVEEAIQLHCFRSGICVCKYCHGKLDERYRRYRNENQKNL